MVSGTLRKRNSLTPGPVLVRGNMSARNKKKEKVRRLCPFLATGKPFAVLHDGLKTLKELPENILESIASDLVSQKQAMN
ncbi:MAG: hypothetical protein ACI8PB_004380 [Desulforhopalus sp.]|jgi:hypothetical protein